MAKQFNTVYPSYPRMPFWGVNIHFWANSPPYKQTNWSAMAASIRAMGFGSVRSGYSGVYSSSNGSITSSASGTFQSFVAAAPDILLHVVLLPQYNVDWTGATATEATAYTMAYNLGVDCATALKGKVSVYECGNEYDGFCITGNAGTNKTDYDNAKFLMCRGSIRGLVDGIRSVDPVARLAFPGIAWLHTGFIDMIFDGSTPSAPTTYDTTKIPKFNIMCLHWYTQNSTGSDNCEALSGQPYSNLMTKAAGYGLPIMITEFGCNTTNTSTGATIYPNGETDIIAALTTKGYLMDKWVAIARSYAVPIVAAYLYQWADAYQNQANPDTSPTTNPNNYKTVLNEMGFGTNDQTTTPKARVAAIAAFIKANPMPAAFY